MLLKRACRSHFARIGFLPIVYRHLHSLYTRYTANGAVQLPETEDDDNEDDDLGPNKHDMQALTGWATLLMWIPAVCDLTGTTVRAHPFHLMLFV